MSGDYHQLLLILPEVMLEHLIRLDRQCRRQVALIHGQHPLLHRKTLDRQHIQGRQLRQGMQRELMNRSLIGDSIPLKMMELPVSHADTKEIGSLAQFRYPQTHLLLHGKDAPRG